MAEVLLTVMQMNRMIWGVTNINDSNEETAFQKLDDFGLLIGISGIGTMYTDLDLTTTAHVAACFLIADTLLLISPDEGVLYTIITPVLRPRGSQTL